MNINSILTNIYDPNTVNQRKTTSATNNANINSDNIFAQASALVAEFKEKKSTNNNSSDNKSGNNVFGLTNSQLVSMDTKDFLNYAYNNKAASSFKDSSKDSSGVDLPMLVSYKGRVVSTAGKSFMQVVAKLSAQCRGTSEEKIAAELMRKYGTFDENGNLVKNNASTDQSSKTTANKFDFSA